MQVRAMLAGVSGIGGGMTRVEGRPRERLGIICRNRFVPDESVSVLIICVVLRLFICLVF